MISRAGLSVTGWQRKGCKLDVKYHGFQCLWKIKPYSPKTNIFTKAVSKILNVNALAILSNFYLKNLFTKFKLGTQNKFAQLKRHVFSRCGYYETVRLPNNFLQVFLFRSANLYQT